MAVKKLSVEEDKYFIASQWQLIRWKFFRHKLAVGAVLILAVFYFLVIFAEIMSHISPTMTAYTGHTSMNNVNTI